MGLLKSVWTLLVCVMMVGFVAGNVVLMGKNLSRSFADLEADFAPKVKPSGESGALYLADPIDACSPLKNTVVGGSKSKFVLIVRGRCSFVDKARLAQNVGFKAAIVYDSEYGDPLIEMGGSQDGIKIHAIFITKASGEVLKNYAGHSDVVTWILPNSEDTSGSIMGFSFILLLAMSAMMAVCLFVCRHRVRRQRPTAPDDPEFTGMSRRLVKAIPSVRFTTVSEDYCTSRTCAICLEDYNKGEKLRILPCCHKFHAICVDSWLTVWRTFCPVCKRDVRTSINIAPASESSPLLSSGASSPSSTAASLSCHSSSLVASPSIRVPSLATSPPVPIVSSPPWSSSSSRTHSLTSNHHMASSYRSHNTSPSMRVNRSFADLRNIPSQRSQVPHLMSPHSIGLPLPSPYSLRHMQPYNPSSSNASTRYLPTYIPSSSNASPSYLVASSGRCSYLQHCESGASLSALASAESLPSC